MQQANAGAKSIIALNPEIGAFGNQRAWSSTKIVMI